MDQDLLGKILIASPGLEDLRFQNTVILICEHTSELSSVFVFICSIHCIMFAPLRNFVHVYTFIYVLSLTGFGVVSLCGQILYKFLWKVILE